MVGVLLLVQQLLLLLVRCRVVALYLLQVRLVRSQSVFLDVVCLIFFGVDGSVPASNLLQRVFDLQAFKTHLVLGLLSLA